MNDTKGKEASKTALLSRGTTVYCWPLCRFLSYKQAPF